MYKMMKEIKHKNVEKGTKKRKKKLVVFTWLRVYRNNRAKAPTPATPPAMPAV